jgi:hypothetical protein
MSKHVHICVCIYVSTLAFTRQSVFILLYMYTVTTEHIQFAVHLSVCISVQVRTYVIYC